LLESKSSETEHLVAILADLGHLEVRWNGKRRAIHILNPEAITNFLAESEQAAWLHDEEDSNA
jgi:hypothetical protein